MFTALLTVVLLADTAPVKPSLGTALDLKPFFRGWDGCFVVLDVSTGTTSRYQPDRCAIRYPPASTFKVANSLVALETGVLEGPDHVIPWDGKKRWREALNRDHDLRSAIRNSVLWYYQEVARRVGEERMARELKSLAFGNADSSSGLTTFWLGGSLRVSANEQVAFLDRLRRGDLPVSDRSREVVLDILVLREGDAVLRGKTGSHRLEEGGLGWFVGWVERGDRTWVFAANAKGDGAWGWEVRKVVDEILRHLEIL